MNIQTLSAAKLLAAIEAQDKITREYNDAFINAGRGHERMSEIRESAKNGFDHLAFMYCREVDKESALNAEKQARLRYHGKLNPIRKAV
jgi:hypothetical protein